MKRFCQFFIWAATASAPTNAWANDPDQHPPEILVLPGVFSTPETGFGAGAGLFVLGKPIQDARPDSPGSKADALRIGAIYTEKKQFVLRGSLEKYVNDKRDLITLSLMAQEYPDSFFGVGGNTRVEDEEKYISYAWEIHTRYLHEVTPRLYVGALATGYGEHITYLKDDGFLATGIDQNQRKFTGSQPYSLRGLGLLVRHDTRDDYQDPVHGYFLEVSTLSRPRELGSVHTFNTSTIDTRWFVPLAAGDNPPRLAFQALGTDMSGNPPFQALAMLGGRDILRGYFLGRYRDRKLAVFQTEFRVPLRGRWGLVGYTAAGNVSRNWSGLLAREFKPAAGAGVRYRFSDVQKVNIRLDATWGRETPNPSFYLSLAEAF